MIHSLATRVAAVATTVLGLILVTAGKAAAMYPPSDPVGRPAPKHTAAVTPVQTVVYGSNGPLLWVVFVATAVVALAVGAALMHLVEHRAHRGQLA